MSASSSIVNKIIMLTYCCCLKHETCHLFKDTRIRLFISNIPDNRRFHLFGMRERTGPLLPICQRGGGQKNLPGQKSMCGINAEAAF